MSSFFRLIGGSFLVAGTSIGGGMLALPLLTAETGFFPSLFIYFLCWLFMASTGLLILEVSLWMKEQSNLVSMSAYTLGKLGQVSAWLLYLFLFYSLMIAYVSGGGNLISLFLDQYLGYTIDIVWSPLLFVFIFAPIVFLGACAIDRINMVCMVGLIISFFSFVYLGLPYIQLDRLMHTNFSASVMAVPLAFTSFAYQGVVPSLVNYFKFDIKKTRQAILIGSFIPFVIYAIWEALILGMIPVDLLKSHKSAIAPLQLIIQSNSVVFIGQLFAFFALTTSFLGVSLGLLDFLADGLKVKKSIKGRLLLLVLVYGPALFISFLNPDLFLDALKYGGGFGVAMLLGLLPTLMVWRGRYQLNKLSSIQLPGGRIVLSLLLGFILLVVLCEIQEILGF